MNRISIAFSFALFAAAVSACSGSDDKQDDPNSQSSELIDPHKITAQTDPTQGAVDPTKTVQETAEITKSCTTCGPLPDPWLKGPLPDPWQGSGGVGTGTPSTGTTTDTGHK